MEAAKYAVERVVAQEGRGASGAVLGWWMMVKGRPEESCR